MKKAYTLFITLAVASVVAPAEAAKGRQAVLKPGSLEEVNQALVGSIATIELVEGKTVRRAKSVRVEPEFIHWNSANGPERVLTSEVTRISIRPRFPVLKGIGVGLAAGTLFGLVAAGSSDSETHLEPVADAAVTAGSMFGGAVVGGLVSKARVKSRGRVVYEAPFDRYLDD